ncbi:HAL protein kinase Ppk8 [Schizosaccharomyces japonicus yFS275]|uniref:non-specific serine/threonine protein kinase n=1 Tax=Schizosaccharomyces japonicus (strain yFS275 / FY16936) TaxID=402676 RepID=B6JX36_SCHJY|nr:HAL protein kinase Ppk8 [Schizosaccharomyces japonicus yFS275]EEB05937.1 HAL protein kinase Ppk8 [Schizosaccharomyces japonicus yFS275]
MTPSYDRDGVIDRSGGALHDNSAPIILMNSSSSSGSSDDRSSPTTIRRHVSFRTAVGTTSSSLPRGSPGFVSLPDTSLASDPYNNPYSRINRNSPPSDPREIPPQFHFKKISHSRSVSSFRNLMLEQRNQRDFLLVDDVEETKRKGDKSPTKERSSLHIRQGSLDLVRVLNPWSSSKKKRELRKVKSSQEVALRQQVSRVPTKYGYVEELIGEGAEGHVYTIATPNEKGIKYVAKQYRQRMPGEGEREYAKRATAEFNICSTLHHPSIIRVYDVLVLNKKYYQIMEYTPYDLFTLVKENQLSNEDKLVLFRQLVASVAYLHSVGLAHRDIKLDNLMLDQKCNLKLIDFGSAFVFQYPFESSAVQARGLIGSEPYLPPEVFQHYSYDARGIDVWSCAIVFCCLMLLRFPWKTPKMTDRSYRNFMEQSKLDPSHVKLLDSLPTDSRPIIKRMLQPNPKDRCSIQEVYESEWVQGIPATLAVSKNTDPSIYAATP